MTLIYYLPLKKALLKFAVAFFSFNTICAQVPLPLSNVNSSFDELHPVFHPSGDLYFARVLQPGNSGISGSGDIWKSSATSEGEFSDPVIVNELVTDSHDLIVGFPDEHTAYVFHHQYEGSHGIFVYQKNSGTWQMDSVLNMPGLRSLGTNFNGRLSKNGKTILMSMQSFGSYGNEDLYFSTWNDKTNSWSRPVNLGPTINSPFQELTPFFREEDGILFFSSNRPGEGSGYQLFYSIKLDDSFTQWSSPVPLTFLDREGITLSFMENPVNGNSFFTSTSSSEGYGDIFIVSPEIQAEISKRIEVDSEEKRNAIPGLAEITKSENAQSPVLIDAASTSERPETKPLSEQEKRQQWIDQVALQVQGFSLKLISPSGELLSAENYASLDGVDGSWILSLPGYIPFTVDWNQPFSEANLTPVEPGSRLDLSIIQFERSSSQLTDSLSIGYINNLADFLLSAPNIKIGLEGHTDNLGNVGLNKTLSTQRASQIRDLLVKKGVDFERIRVSGYGGTRPKADNKTEEGRILNRRVELVILEN